jgi:hypothetical protein
VDVQADEEGMICHGSPRSVPEDRATRAVTLVEIQTTSSDTSGRTAATFSSPHGKHLA